MDQLTKMKMWFGFILLVLLGVLAAVFGLGTVKAESSHGLDQILGGLLVLAGGFAHWAFESNARAALEAKE